MAKQSLNNINGAPAYNDNYNYNKDKSQKYMVNNRAKAP